MSREESAAFDSLTTATWVRVAEIFDRALEIPSEHRDAWLDEACAGNAALRAEVVALLAADAAPATLLEGDAAAAASTLVERVEAGERDIEDERWLGRRIGPYRVREILGQGGMGTVFLAERADGQFEERVALKLLRCCTTSDELLRRFQQERQILARLRHSTIAGLLHGGVTDDGQPYFAMEHVDGLPITDYCDTRSLGVEGRLELATQVTDGVQHAHRNLVVHRDLKPSNILVTDEGAVRLLDFGIAKLLEPGLGETADEDDAAGDAVTMLLTPQYAAPEQLTGQPVTTATDVYALGVLLYELLTGGLPFANALLGVVQGGDPEPPSRRVRTSEAPQCGLDAATLSRRLEGDLDAVVLKALRAEPEQRYPTPEALGEDLRRHLDKQPVRARRATWRYRARKFVTRHRASVVAAALAILALLAGLAGTSWQAAEARRATARAEKEAEVAQQVADFLATTFTSADPAASGENDVTARDLLDAAAVRIGEELEGAPEIQARLLGILGVTYRQLSLYDESRPLLERSLELRREHAESDPEALAGSLFSLAQLENDLGHYDVAEPLFREALDLSRAESGNERHVATSLHGLAGLLIRTRRVDRGMEMLEKALALAQPAFGEQHPQTLNILGDLAFVHLGENRLDLAVPLLRDLLERKREVYGNVHPSTAITLHNLAVATLNSNRLEEAVTSFREVLEIERRLYDEDQPATAGTLGFLGHALRELGKLEEAEEAYRESVAVLRRKLPSEHPYLGTGLKNLGWILIELGRPSEAESLLQESVAILHAAHGEDHQRTQEALMQLGRAVLADGRPAEAEPLLRSAYARLLEMRGEDHSATLLALAAIEELEAALVASGVR